MQLLVLALSFLLASPIAAHGGVTGYKIDGKYYAGYQIGTGNQRLDTHPPGGPTIQRSWAKLHPVTEFGSPYMACNTPGTPGKIEASIKAGGQITAIWNKWPHDGGPLTVWMTECPGDCAGWTSPQSGSWFKIHEGGMEGGKWATSKMIREQDALTVTIPASLKPGNYLIRHELINIARAPERPEFYPECAALKVTGSGTASPPASERAKLPGAYKKSDIAFKYQFNQWTPAKASQYVIPGPKVWKGSKA